MVLALHPSGLARAADAPGPKPLTPAEAGAVAARAASSKAYGQATAHQPMFENKELWGSYEVERTHYATQKWAPARVLVFRHTSGGPHAMSDPGNWIDQATGKPADKGPDENTDVVLPDSQTPYSLARESGLHFRHVTWGRGASIQGKRAPTETTIHGNVWVKQGGNFHHQMRKYFVGDMHTFCRNDNADVDNNEGAGAQYAYVDKGGSASIEFLGTFSCGDNFGFTRGHIIVGPTSWLGTGARSIQKVEEGSILQLQDRAYFGKRTATEYSDIELIVAGEVRLGSTERPVKESAYLGFTPADFRLRRDGEKSVLSLVLQPTAQIEAHPAPGADAVLHIGQHFLSAYRNGDEYESLKSRAIQVVVFDGARVKGPVIFHDLEPGRLFLEQPKAIGSWKDVRTGERSVPLSEASRDFDETIKTRRNWKAG